MFKSVVSLFKKSANWRTFFLTLFGTVYLVLGAVVFKSVESENEVVMNNHLSAEQDEMKMKYNISDDDFNNLTMTIMQLEPHRAGVQWGFSGSIYFAITVVTTIGYGHSVPQTPLGKLLCIFYAIFGIPLWLVTFQGMGERINTGAKYAFKIVGHKMGFKFDQISHKCLIPFGILTCVLTLLVGTLSFAHFENWSHLDSAYYCVMTLSTIGFGDYVALQRGKSLTQAPEYVGFTLVYIMIGLAVIGAFLNLVILRLMVTLPVTPEHSVSGGSKKNSSQCSRTLSINSRRSQFDDVNSTADDDRTSQRSLRECCEVHCCCLERETYLHDQRYVPLGDEASPETCETISKKNLGYWVTDYGAGTSKWTDKLCMNCKQHMCNLCEDCRVLLFQCCVCWANYCSACPCPEEANRDSLSQNEDGPSSSSDPTTSYCFTSYPSQANQEEKCHHHQNEEVEPRYTTSFIPSTSTTDSSYQNSACIPEVTVSHIKVSVPEQSYGSNNTNANNGEYATSNFLSPADCYLRRDRFGSGDSGYLGGAQSSTGNVSNENDDESSYCPKSTESGMNFDMKTRPVSLPPKFDHLVLSQTFSDSSYKISDNDSYSSYVTERPTPENSGHSTVIETTEISNLSPNKLSAFSQNNFKRHSFTSLQKVENNWKHWRKKHLRRETSMSCHSDTEIGYNRTDEVVTHDKDLVVKTHESKFLPMANEQQKNVSKSETLSLRKLYQTVASKQRKKREFSTSLSHQERDETSVAILNSGEWEDHHLSSSPVSRESHLTAVIQKSNYCTDQHKIKFLHQKPTISNSSIVISEKPCELYRTATSKNNSNAILMTDSSNLVKKRSYSDSTLTSSHQKCCIMSHCCRCALLASGVAHHFFHVPHHKHSCLCAKHRFIHNHNFHGCHKWKSHLKSEDPYEKKEKPSNLRHRQVVPSFMQERSEVPISTVCQNETNSIHNKSNSSTPRKVLELAVSSRSMQQDLTDDVFTDHVPRESSSDNELTIIEPIYVLKSECELSKHSLPC